MSNITAKMRNWRHVYKLDPNRELSEEDIRLLLQSGTDAIIIGGTDGVTFANTQSLLHRVKQDHVPCVQEVSSTDAVVPGFDGYLIPTVLNTEAGKWILGVHQQTIKKYGELIPWNMLAVEGYVILNPEAKVATLTKAITSLDTHDIEAYVRVAEHLFHLPFLYIEYSGTYGDVEKVKAARQCLATTKLIYGGGITNEWQTKEMAMWADIVVVGNVIYNDLKSALRTVAWVKETSLMWG